MVTTCGMTNHSTYTLHISELPSWAGALQATILILIVVNNVLVLFIFKNIRELKTQHHLMIGLSVADLLTLVPYSTVVYTTLNGSIQLTRVTCDIIGAIFTITLAVTTWIHSCMCMEKCFAIRRPLKHRTFMASNKVLPASITILLACFLLPFLLAGLAIHWGILEIKFLPYVSSCAYDANLLTYLIFGGLYLALPLTVQIATHLLMIRTRKVGVVFPTRGSIIKRAGNFGEAGARIKRLHFPKFVTSTHGALTQPPIRTNSKLRAIRTISLTLGIYYCCWSPLIIQTIWNSLPGVESPVWFDAVTVNMMVANSGMSFIIYSITLPLFRKQLLVEKDKLLRKCKMWR